MISGKEAAREQISVLAWLRRSTVRLTKIWFVRSIHACKPAFLLAPNVADIKNRA